MQISESILSRDLFYSPRRGPAFNRTFRFLDFCLIDTPLGAMVEPRMLVMSTTLSGSGFTNINADEVSFTRISEMDETTMLDKLGTAGLQLPVDYNTQ